jgi:hypothetical protein
MPHTRSIVLALSAFTLCVFCPCARASTIGFQFNATLQTGALAGTSFSGTASYNNAGETGVGMEYPPLTSLNFTLLGDPFNASEISQGGQVITENGVFSYFTAAFFPSTGPVDDIAFGFGGPGIIGYSTPPGFNPGQGVYVVASPTPEPSTFSLCGIALLVGCCLLGRRRSFPWALAQA